MLRNVPDEAIGEAELSALYEKLDSWTEKMPTNELMSVLNFERQSHEVKKFEAWDSTSGSVTIESKFWKDGNLYVSERNLPFVAGEPVYK